MIGMLKFKSTDFPLKNISIKLAKSLVFLTSWTKLSIK